MNSGAIYETGKLTFYLYPTSIVFCTTMQCTRISYNNYQFKTYLDKLKIAIIDGQVKTPADISEYCNGAKLQWTNAAKQSI